MSSNFSANQYQDAFRSSRLCNWTVPRVHKERPSRLEGFTTPVSNERGHLLPDIKRSTKSPWGSFRGTWQLKKSDMIKTVPQQSPTKTWQY
ncbi:protein Flattop homolog [Corticium candelabrum]|uniref:protein Flattop homolog n=1 Tax=Corticium candelabrum TaxID=121492 RepID=UPI002E253E2D|nr:protein Flattop homolog [Corticium candelabrum]